MNKNIKLKINGQVQGVWFRESAKKKAEELGLTGLVRNESDGSVIVEAEGEEEDLKSLIEWCYRGSEFSHVKRVEIEEKEELKNYPEFKIAF